MANRLIGTYLIETNQTLFDLAIQKYGTIEAVYDMIAENDWLESIDQDEVHGYTLNFDAEANHINDFFRKRIKTVSTEDPIQPINPITDTPSPVNPYPPLPTGTGDHNEDHSDDYLNPNNFL